MRCVAGWVFVLTGVYYLGIIAAYLMEPSPSSPRLML